MDWLGLIDFGADWWMYQPKNPLLFNTKEFFVLFLIFYPIYALLGKSNTRYLRQWWTIGFSIFFYYKSSGFFFFLLILSTLIDYLIGMRLHKEERERNRKLLLVLSMLLNLGLLGYFKYTNFLIFNINAIFDGSIGFLDIALPVGISFYTFQSMSYIIDIYRRELAPTKDISDYLFFVSFFPQLVAGPIVRASDFIPQIYKKLELTPEMRDRALMLIMSGLIKKTVISDYISTNFVDRVFDAPTLYTPIENLLAVYGYTIQIYCDFSGYSDMAIGIALLLGIRLPLNFRTPYQSKNITEFWRRWHISLSSWLRDYLYISMGGNRKGTFRTYFNLFMTMFLGGLWHGASWNFIVWGILHGLALVVERLVKGFRIWPKWRIATVFQVLLTLHFVAFCWIFFRAKSFDIAYQLIGMIGKITWDLDQWNAVISAYKPTFLLMAIAFVWHFIPEDFIQASQRFYIRLPLVVKAVLFAAVIWLMKAVATSGPQPFIYFQF